MTRQFQQVFSESKFTRPCLPGVEFKQISQVDSSFLITPFLELEIKAAVWSCDGDKSLGPDGFNFQFSRRVGNF